LLRRVLLGGLLKRTAQGWWPELRRHAGEIKGWSLQGLQLLRKYWQLRC
jgi:hypothetical protein